MLASSCIGSMPVVVSIDASITAISVPYTISNIDSYDIFISRAIDTKSQVQDVRNPVKPEALCCNIVPRYTLFFSRCMHLINNDVLELKDVYRHPTQYLNELPRAQHWIQ